MVETLIGDEILDETDRYVDNERTQRVESLELPEHFRVRGEGGKRAFAAVPSLQLCPQCIGASVCLVDY